MFEPAEVEAALGQRLHAVATDKEPLTSQRQRYRYTVQLDQYRTTPLINTQIKEVDELSELQFMLDGVDLTLHVEDNTAEARIEVAVVETVDRRVLKNRSLKEFEAREDQKP